MVECDYDLKIVLFKVGGNVWYRQPGPCHTHIHGMDTSCISRISSIRYDECKMLHMFSVSHTHLYNTSCVK